MNRKPAVTGILLAAGRSERFGESNKLLTPIDGTPIVRRAVQPLLEADISDVVVVVGHDANRIERSLADIPVTCIRNPEYRTGQASSVRVGIEHVYTRADAAVIALGDMPCVSAESIDRLIRAYRDGNGDVLVAAYEGVRGNPVLFDEKWFDDLRRLDGDVGAREIVRRHGTLIETGDPGVRSDVDTLEDLPDHAIDS